MAERGDPAPGLGIYLHIPFCRHECPYCGFNSGPHSEAISRRYLEALREEIRTNPWAGYPVPSVSFGGGLPSELDPGDIASLVDAVRGVFRVAGDAEWSLECTPDTLTPDFLKTLRRQGINRLSLGAQSFRDRHLRGLGYRHEVRDIRRSFEWARSTGFENINLDLLYGLPGQTPGEWMDDLEQALAMAPEHLSLYNFVAGEGAELARSTEAGQLPEPDDETVARIFESAMDRIAEAGYVHYHVSSFARPGREWRQGEIYWKGSAYLGLGASAASFIQGTRWTHTPDLDSYIRGVWAGAAPRASEEHLSGLRALGEDMLLGLERREGVSLSRLSVRYGRDVGRLFREPLRFLSERGLVSWRDDRVSLTRRGLLLSDAVGAEFLAAPAGRASG